MLLLGVVNTEVGGAGNEVGVACDLDGFRGRVCFGGRPRFVLPVGPVTVYTPLSV